MATTRPFAYNTGSTIDGTIQIGNIAIGVTEQDYSQNPGGVKWWMGPDEELGYVIAHEVPAGDQPTPVEVDASISFWRSTSLTDQSLLDLLNVLPITDGLPLFTNINDAQTWLITNGHFTSYDNNLPTPTPTPTLGIPTATPTPTPTSTSTPTPVPTDTPTPTPTVTSTPTPQPTDTPTPTPTVTSTPTVTPTSTPTPTPTPTATEVPPTPTPTSASCSGIRYNLTDQNVSPVSGNTLWMYNGLPIGASNEVNKLAIGNPFFISRYDSDGTDQLTYFGNLTGNTFTMVVCQDGNSAIYSGITGTISYDGSSFFQFDATKLHLSQSSPVTAFTFNQSVYYDFSVIGAATPTPTPTSAPTSTPTPTPAPTDTPTPTPTATEVPPTSTPTPTPTSGSSGQGSWYFYSDEGNINAMAPTSNGNAIFTTQSPIVETFNPNAIDGVSYLHFNTKDSSGTDYTSQFSQYTGGTGTITISQNGDTATYTSTTSGSFMIQTIGGGSFFMIDTSKCDQTKESNNSYVFADAISLSFS